MEKRTLKQWTIEDKLAKLAQWNANPDWLPTEAAKKLDVPKGTLMGWKKQFSGDQPPNPEPSGRMRKPGAGRKHKLEPYELDVLAYYDRRLADGERVNAGELLKYCQEIPSFALRNENTQKSWVLRFIKRYKTARGTADRGGHDDACPLPSQTTRETGSDTSEITPTGNGAGGSETQRDAGSGASAGEIPDANESSVSDDDEDGSASANSDSSKSHVSDSSASDEAEESEDSSDAESDYVDSTVEVPSAKPARTLRSQAKKPVQMVLTYQYKNAHEPSGVDRTGYVLREDVNSLQPEKFVSSGIVDFMISQFFAQAENICTVDTYFFKYAQIGFQQKKKSPRQMAGNVPILNSQFLMIPICAKNHWSFLVVERALGDHTTVHHIDSYSGIHHAPSIFAVVDWYFATVKKAAFGQKAKYESAAYVYPTQPQQTNKHDCAFYMMYHMKRVMNYVEKNKPDSLTDAMGSLTKGFNLTKAEASRSKMHEYLKAKIDKA